MTFRCVAYYRTPLRRTSVGWRVIQLGGEGEGDLVREGVAMHLKVEERCRYAYCDSLFEVHGDRVVQEA